MNERQVNRVSDGAVKKATGRNWDEWVEFIDQNGGRQRSHQTIVALVGGKGAVESGWWQQMVTVGYEHATGRRQTGQTSDVGYQLGIQRVMPVGQAQLWRFLWSDAGRAIWLGRSAPIALEPGHRFETDEALTGEIRTVKPTERVRLTWQPAERKSATTLQLTLTCPRNTPSKTTLRFHHEKLADIEERDQLRTHWKAVLDGLERCVSK